MEGVAKDKKLKNNMNKRSFLKSVIGFAGLTFTNLLSVFGESNGDLVSASGSVQKDQPTHCRIRCGCAEKYGAFCVLFNYREGHNLKSSFSEKLLGGFLV